MSGSGAADLLIVGGGPAGLATAIEAAREGMRVVVIEQRSGVIDKACGEGLMPPALQDLAEMGVELPSAHPFRGIRYVKEGHAAEARFRGGHGAGVRRTILHEALETRAAALGVARVHGRVTEIRQTVDLVEVMGLRAPWLVAADGLHSAIRRSLGVERPPRHARRYGVRQHFYAEPWSDLVEVHWNDDAEAYVTPVAADVVGVAVLFRGRGAFGSWLERFPAIARRLGAPASTARGAGPFERRVAKRTVGRVALVGDAAGFLDPLTGEGIGLAIAAARVLIRCLADGQIDAYESAWRGVTRRYRLFTAALLCAGQVPTLRRRLVPFLERFPSVFELGLRSMVGGGRHRPPRTRLASPQPSFTGSEPM